MAKRSIGYFIYNIIILLTSILAVPFLIIRNLMLHRPVAPYFGKISPNEAGLLKDKKVIWIQAVSLGESMVACSLIRELKRVFPAHQVVLTATTPTGYHNARQKLGDLALVTYFPLDLPFLMSSFCAKIHPSLYIMVESEFWPNAIRANKRHGAKIALVNGRISEKSLKNYLRVSGFVKTMLEQFDLLAMQSVADANRIGLMGAPLERIMVTGNLKFDQEFPDFSAEQLESFRSKYGLTKDQRVLVAASTHRGEEEIILETFVNLAKEQPFFLILAPRHPDRAPEVIKLIQEQNLRFVRRSSGEDSKDTPVLLFDTFGELGLAYAAADLVFVGGSLVDSGGQNILEPAAQSKPVIYGPHMDDFLEAKRLLEEADAGITVHNAAELTDNIKKLVADNALYRRRAENARNAVLANRGAARNTAKLIAALLGSES